MGSSAVAYLFYGFVLRDSEDDSLIFEDAEDRNWYDWSGYLLNKVGITYEDNKELYFAEKRKLEKEFKCDIDYCGYSIYSKAIRPYLFVKDSRTKAYASEESVCNVTKLDIWDLWLKQFCDKLGIEFRQPNWTLVAYYG